MIEKDFESIRVLVVEDDPVDVDLLRLALEHDTAWMPSTVVAQDGEQAIAVLEQHAANPASPKPDLIVLDLNLPGQDGTEVLKMIRATENLSSIPVAVVSSSPEDVIQKRLHSAGVSADAHFTKPTDLDDFLKLGSTLRVWLDQHKELLDDPRGNNDEAA